MYDYISHHAEISSFSGDLGVQLDKYDNKHSLPHDDLGRAVYINWRVKETGVPELLSKDYKALLEKNNLL